MNVTVTVLRDNTNLKTKAETPLVSAGAGCMVYVFRSKHNAAEYYNNKKTAMRDEGAVAIVTAEKKTWEKVDTTTREGICDIIAKSNWYLVAYSEQDRLFCKHVVSIDGQENVSIELAPLDIALAEQTVKGKYKYKEAVDSTYDCGDLRTIDIRYPLPSEDTNSTFRYGMAPYCKELSGDMYGFTSAYQTIAPNVGVTVKKMRPYIIDGENYHKTQYRKMGYDEEHDPMERYVKALQVKTRDKEEVDFHIHEQLSNMKSDAIYPVYAYRWYENYGSLIVGDTIPLHLGYRNDRTRFLDFEFPEVGIQTKKFEYPPREEPNEGTASLDIVFVKGEAEILSSDSVGLEQLNSVIQTLAGIDGDEDAQLFSVNVHGYASPEGGVAVNESLCQRRAAYLKSKIAQRMRRLNSADITSEGDVASWKDVAEELRKDSVSDHENVMRAQQIEELLSSVHDESLVEAKLRATPLYAYLRENEDKYYKPLRKVLVSYVYTQKSILTREQVIERYAQKRELTYYYQYQYLFEYLKDRPEELGRVAEKAMKSLPLENTGKSWPLAAYYLAKSYADRNMCDTMLLKPYITLTGKECMEEQPGSMRRTCSTLLNSEHFNMQGSRVQYMNDEGIVLLQLSMLVRANKISAALNLADHLFPKEEPKYAQPKMMLECLCRKMYNNPEVREKVAATSNWNKVVVYAAQDANPQMDESLWEDAWNLLSDSTLFHMESARELYMKATLAHRLYESAKNWNGRRDKVPVPRRFFETNGVSVYAAPSLSDDYYPWGAMMVKACEMDPAFINVLKYDGEFSQNYRDGFALYWNEIHPDKILR